ncbi:MAG: hypothetical protein GY743_23215 [Planctomycetaceae bacterium]|nr:hypothetical protein [Planctomycetaceae bacterium]
MFAVEATITKAVEKKAPYCVDMIAGWINLSLIGNRHIVKKLTHCRFTYTSDEKMRFTARAIVSTGLNFDKIIPCKFVWTLKNGKHKANLEAIGV